MKIAIIGNYGATNIGDEAILAAFLRHHGRRDISVFSASPEHTKAEFGVDSHPIFPLGIRSFFRRGLHGPMRALKKADVVVLGGGGLFQDDKLFACFLWAWQVFWIRRLKKPFYVYAAGVGPLKTKIGRKLALKALSYARVVTVRDEASKKLLEDIGFDGDIAVTADPAFLFKPAAAGKERHKNLYIISLRPWKRYDSDLVNHFTKALLYAKNEKKAKFMFVVMQEVKEHDLKIIEALQKRVGGEIVRPKHYSELLSLMQEAEFAIGMRYHFLIAALLTNTPALAVSYSPKVSSLFTTKTLQRNLIPVEEVDDKRLIEGLKELSVNYNNIKVDQKARLEQLKESAEKNIEIFESFLKTFDEKG